MDPKLSLHSTKWAVFLISLLTALAGMGMIVVAIYSLNDPTATLGDRTAPTMTLILGALVFLVSFLGCFGTIAENKHILWSFLAGLIVLVIIQVILSIVALANKGTVDSYMDDAWDRAYDKHPRILRDIQEEYACCGFRYTTDRAIPKSSPDACLKSIEFGYQISCYRALIGGYKRLQTTVGIVGIILSSIQIIAVFLTYLLIRNLPDKPGDEYTRLLSGSTHPDTSTDVYGRSYQTYPTSTGPYTQPGMGGRGLGGAVPTEGYAPGGYGTMPSETAAPQTEVTGAKP